MKLHITARIMGTLTVVAGMALWVNGCRERVEYGHRDHQPQPGWTEVTGQICIDGRPCEEGQVTVFWGKGRAYRQACGTDRRGRFTVDNIPACREISVEMRARHHGREYLAKRSGFTGKPGEILSLGLIDIRENCPEPGPMPHPAPAPCPGPVAKCDLKVSGYVFFEGKPVKDATVRAICPGIYESKTKTDKKGYFRVKDVPRKVRLNIYAEKKIHHGKLVSSADIATGRNDIGIGVINMCEVKK